MAWSVTDPIEDIYEAFARCRHCYRSSVASIRQARINIKLTDLAGNFINSSFDFCEWVHMLPKARECPAFVPEKIERIFVEAATCEAAGLWDAGGAMYRKVLDAATRGKTPTPVEGDKGTPAWKVYKDLRLRLDWLFDHGLLDQGLKDLSSCIHQDGNDAAHDLEGIGQNEATDLGDFCEVVLRTIYTIPGQIEDNKRRREERRGPSR